MTLRPVKIPLDIDNIVTAITGRANDATRTDVVIDKTIITVPVISIIFLFFLDFFNLDWHSRSFFFQIIPYVF